MKRMRPILHHLMRRLPSNIYYPIHAKSLRSNVCSIVQPQLKRRVSWIQLRAFASIQKDASSEGLIPIKLIAAYTAVALSTMGAIAWYKSLDNEDEESARIYNMAKRSVVKDRRLFDAIGYPKTFERMLPQDNLEEHAKLQINEGAFQAIGSDGASAIVTYRSIVHNESDNAMKVTTNSPVRFDKLLVTLDDGTQFSALEAVEEFITPAERRASVGALVSSQLVVPLASGILLGGFAAFIVIRILRNRPSYLQRLAIERVNKNDRAKLLLGAPIVSDSKSIVGSLTMDAANYTVVCNGPNGKGTLTVNAYKAQAPKGEEENAPQPIPLNTKATTPGTAWVFSILTLDIPKNNQLSDARNKNKGKNRTINLLA